MATKSQAQTATLDPQQDRLLRLADVRFISGLGKTSIYAAVRAKTFPQPVKVTDYAVAWRKSEVDAWLAGRPAARAEQVDQHAAVSTTSAREGQPTPSAERSRRTRPVGAPAASAGRHPSKRSRTTTPRATA